MTNPHKSVEAVIDDLGRLICTTPNDLCPAITEAITTLRAQQRKLEEPPIALLDYFAGEVLAGICGHVDTWGLLDEEIVERAYRLGKLMLETRGKYL